MQQKSLVAVCDILGFSNLVQTVALDAVVTNAIGWFRKALHHSMHKGAFLEFPPSIQSLDNHKYVGVAWFSDTIFLYTKEDSDDAIRALLEVIAWLLFETMIQGITRVRAGLAYGEIFIDPQNSLYVGTPIIEAYNLEQQQQWSGAALSKSAELRIPEYARTGNYADWWIVPHKVPLKETGPTNLLAVNWAQGIHSSNWRLSWSSKSEIPEPSDWEKDRSRCEKFMNTKDFHDTNCKPCRA